MYFVVPVPTKFYCIDTRSLWLELRKRIAGMKQPALMMLFGNVAGQSEHFQFENEERLEWAEDLDEPEVVEPRVGR